MGGFTLAGRAAKGASRAANAVGRPGGEMGGARHWQYGRLEVGKETIYES